jgi:DNA-binding CsgD family transcriptional regulator
MNHPTATPTSDAPAAQRVWDLSARQVQVLVAMAAGLSNAEIGRRLFLSEDTVKTHGRKIYAKLKARDRAHAVSLGYQLGLLPTAGSSPVREAIAAEILSLAPPCPRHALAAPRACTGCAAYTALTAAAQIARNGTGHAAAGRRAGGAA